MLSIQCLMTKPTDYINKAIDLVFTDENDLISLDPKKGSVDNDPRVIAIRSKCFFILEFFFFLALSSLRIQRIRFSFWIGQFSHHLFLINSCWLQLCLLIAYSRWFSFEIWFHWWRICDDLAKYARLFLVEETKPRTNNLTCRSYGIPSETSLDFIGYRLSLDFYRFHNILMISNVQQISIV